MKKAVLIVLTAICLSVSGFGQTPESSKNYVYCELIGQGKLFSSKIKVQVDFGQETSLWKVGSDRLLKDENGKNIEFNSMVDALNYFSAQGWEFVQAYVVIEDKCSVCHWLLKKEITREEANEVTDKIIKK